MGVDVSEVWGRCYGSQITQSHPAFLGILGVCGTYNRVLWAWSGPEGPRGCPLPHLGSGQLSSLTQVPWAPSPAAGRLAMPQQAPG